MTDQGSWPLPETNRIKIVDLQAVDSFDRAKKQILVLAEGWVEGPKTAILRGGINAKAVLEVLAALGIKEITVYHIEEKIPQLEEIFLSTVVTEANKLFDSVKIFWRHETSIFDLVAKIGSDYPMLFFGAPLAKSEVEPFLHQLKEVYPGKIVLVRGTISDLEFDEGDEIFNWVRKNTYDASDFALPAVLRNYKKKLDVKTSVILPSLNEAKTIAKVIETALEVKNVGIIDEVILVDSASTDDTAAIARKYEIPVYQHQQIRSELGAYHGKGEAMFKSGFITDADIIAWVDTDIENITPTFFYGLLGPIFADANIRFVKGYFARPVRVEASGIELGGGRVTEILARPWINTYMPQLSGYIQPLAGTVAIYSDLFRKMKIPTNYGVEIAMLIQAVEQVGLGATCQVNLGEVIHKSKDVMDLSEMAFQIMQVLASLTVTGKFKPPLKYDPVLRHIISTQGHFEISAKRFKTYWREFSD